MMSGIIYGRQLDMFSLGVHYTLKNLAGDQRITPNGIRGRRWFPLNLLALAGTFVSTFFRCFTHLMLILLGLRL